ncbi:MAG: hypothetical protein WBB98_00815 [Xanthobacteraceae bacterium]
MASVLSSSFFNDAPAVAIFKAGMAAEFGFSSWEDSGRNLSSNWFCPLILPTRNRPTARPA